MNRRFFLMAGGATATAAGTTARAATFEVTRSDREWRAMLSDLEYRVMREEGTEPPGSSPLDSVYDAGVYHCRGCNLGLYPSDTKYDSGTGWPSFWASLPDAVAT